MPLSEPRASGALGVSEPGSGSLGCMKGVHPAARQESPDMDAGLGVSCNALLYREERILAALLSRQNYSFIAYLSDSQRAKSSS